METSNKSNGETLFDLTLFAADTPANLLALQDTEKELMTHAICGRGSLMPLANYDPATQSWKMYGDTYLWGDSPLLETLPPSGMTLNGELFLQPAWEPITAETDCSLWPTPKANLHKTRRWYLRPDGYRHNAGEIPPGMEFLSGQPINLDWLEWTMGFPIGWTELKQSEMP